GLEASVADPLVCVVCPLGVGQAGFGDDPGVGDFFAGDGVGEVLHGGGVAVVAEGGGGGHGGEFAQRAMPVFVGQARVGRVPVGFERGTEPTEQHGHVGD